ncbi:MAG: Asp-tRNA(Asn)/Glu-tRNA(Gln) amidotransferase subunit GatC [Deltaproteobacteria bacterium]|nr:Asp-tRNA(Asn)/Glu-tRNA(Gln) amidotransferase subunit GatC [Deltaproteobacteria bacterium]MBW2121462.1 Asp-tRNA(Asn)/Glu-tRNA(Gln) amidotransferase subunit GatC [Deltaproteobacteria bacterium]
MDRDRISREEVRYLAGLARLRLSEGETETFAVQLNRILSYMEKLNELDTSRVEPMSHVVGMSNAFREDAVQESFSQEEALQNAPEREGGFFKVPRIVKG